MTSLSRGLTAVFASAALLAPATASAAPVTVNLRIEGASQTVFEGPVTTDARQIPDASTGQTKPCNVRDNGGNGGRGEAQGNATTAAFDATTANGLGFSASYTGSSSFGEVNDFFVTRLGPDTAQSSPPFAYHQLYVNGAFAQTGGCQIAAVAGQEVVWGYSADANRVLRLTAPATVRPGEPFTVTVTNALDQTAVRGATVGGGTTDARGQARVTVRERGARTLKAEAAESIRSNAATVCATDGADGFCGTKTPQGETIEPAPQQQQQTQQQSQEQQPGGSTTTGTSASSQAPAPVLADRTSPFARIGSIREDQVFARGAGPRVLRGSVADASAIRTVKLRLTRNDRGRCSSYSGRRERFVRRPCGAANGFFFRIEDDAQWEYQLAERLPRGRYVLDVNAIDTAFNRDDTRRRGSNRVVFTVR
jgi:hypothetical protein